MIPIRIEDTLERVPWMNWLLISATTALSVWLFNHPNPELVAKYFVYSDRYPLSLLGNIFAHANYLHLIGNMVFLWVFGNGVCSIMGNFTYGATYVALGVGASLIHKLADGREVLGASGAICGVVAIGVTFFPFARVSLFWMLAMLPRISKVPLWGIALYWTSFDVLRAYVGHSQIASWAHLGGTACGLVAGSVMLLTNYVRFSHYDDPTLLDFVMRRTREDLLHLRGERHRAPVKTQDAGEHAHPTAERQKLKLRVGAGAAAAAAAGVAPANTFDPTAHSEPTTSVAAIAPANVAAAGVSNFALTHATETPAAEEKPLPVLSLRRRSTAPSETPAPAASPANTSLATTPAAIVPAAAPVVDSPAPTVVAVAAAVADCFIFDGANRLGPMTAVEAQRQIHQAAHTTNWMFWQQGMAGWEPVEAKAPVSAPHPTGSLGNAGALGTA